MSKPGVKFNEVGIDKENQSTPGTSCARYVTK